MTTNASDDVLALEGHADVCAICSAPIDEYGLGMAGLNAVLCEHCVANLGLYTPGWWCIVREGNDHLNVWQYGCYPESPYWQSGTSPTFLDHPTLDATDPALVREFYAGLEDNITAILEQLVSDSLPDAFEGVSGDFVPTGAIMDVHVGRRDPDEDNPYVNAQSYLPRPYLVTGGSVYADFSNATVDATTIKRILSGGDAEMESQSALSTFDAPATDTNNPDQSQSGSEKPSETNGEKAEAEPAGQTALTGFTTSD